MPQINSKVTFINVGFPISALEWAYRLHEKNSCVEYLAVGIASIDFSTEGDELNKITKENFGLNYFNINSEKNKNHYNNNNGHILIYRVHINNILNIMDDVQLRLMILIKNI